MTTIPTMHYVWATQGKLPNSCMMKSEALQCLQVVEGLDIVQQIEKSKTDRMDRPQNPVVISGAGEL